MIKKKRPETMIERIERAHHMYDNGPKPKHYGDKSIVDMEEWNSMNGLQKKTPVVTKEGPFESALTKIQRPKPFKSEDPSTYPMNQKKSMSQWEAVLEHLVEAWILQELCLRKLNLNFNRRVEGIISAVD